MSKKSVFSTIITACPEGASVPSLGLSNKAVYEETNINQAQEEKHIKEQYPENYFVPINLSGIYLISVFLK